MSEFMINKGKSLSSFELKRVDGGSRLYIAGKDRTAEFLNAVYRGKSLSDDPRTSGGWDILDGNPQWIGADEIFGRANSFELETFYRRMTLVYTCVRKICQTALEAPLRIGRETSDGQWKDVKTDYRNRLCADPNSEMSYAEFLWHYISHLELTGHTYVWKWRNSLNQISEMWPMPTTMVKEVRDPKTGRLDHYLIFMGGSNPWKPVERRDIIRQVYPDPTNPAHGLGPLQAAIREVHTDSERQDYIVEMMANSRTPGMIFYQPEGWDEPQKDEVRAAILDGLGKGRRGRPVFIQGEGAKVEQQAPLKDLDWPGISNLSETRVCSAFDVPPIIVGLRSGLENGTYSNYEQALKAFYHSMAARWKMLDGGLTRGLFRDEGENRLQAYHDTEDVRGLRDDEDKQVDRAIKIYSAGLCEYNDARKMIGLPPVEGALGKQRVMPANLIPATDDDEEVTPPPDTGAPDQGDPIVPAPADEKEAEPGGGGTNQVIN